MRLEGELLVAGPEARGPVLILDAPVGGPAALPADSDHKVVVSSSLVASPVSKATKDALWLALLIEDRPTGDPSTSVPGPVVRIDRDLFRTGEVVSVDGRVGTVELPGVREIRVVTSFLQAPDGKVLLLRRSSKVGTFQGRWAGVSGFLESPTAEAQAYTEIREETGLDASEIELVAAGSRVYARDGDRVFVVYPFRFRVLSKRFRLDWEHSEAEWVDPTEICRRTTVPKLRRVWEAVASA